MSDKKLLIKLAADVEALKNGLRNAGREVNTFEKGVISAGKMIGTYFGATTIYRGLEYGVKTLAQFEKQMDTVAAITGATGGEIKELQDNALNLAGSFRSIDIARMETELGRLGLSTREIIDSTKSIVALATATGEDLAKSADTVGSTLRIYNLEATRAGEVTDIMAQGFNMSALALDNFTEAIKYVGPVANAAGLSLQQTTALLGVLADNGIRGSMAGTSLRKIISDLGKGAAPVLTERLREMAAAGLSGADAMDEVGRTAYASLLILANNTEKVNNLTKSLNDSNGAAGQTAKIMEDNLIGDFNKLRAGIDQTILSGSGWVTVLRELTQATTLFLKASDHGKAPSAFTGRTWLDDLMMALPGLSQFAEEWDSDQATWDNRIKDWEERYRKTWDIFNATQNITRGPSPIAAATKNPAIPSEGDPTFEQFQSFNDGLLKIEQTYLAEKEALNKESNDIMTQIYDEWYNSQQVANQKALEDSVSYFEGLKSEREKYIEGLRRDAQIIASIGDAVGDAFVQSIRSGESFVQALTGQIDQAAQQLYRLAISYIIANAAKMNHPLAAIAIATAGVIGIRSLFAMANKEGSSTSTALPRGADYRGSETYVFELHGDVLRAANRRSTYNATKLGG
jgi:hypothetical protein